jgi:hypothetical protein
MGKINKVNKMRESGIAERRWQGLYKLGGGAALIIAVLLAGEVLVYAILPRPTTALEQLELFQTNWLVGLFNLDLLGMISYLLFIPTILALYVVLRRTSEAVMAVATALFFVGISAFFATNTAFSLLTLSNHYAAATTDEERAIFLAAGQTMITLFNEQAFLVTYVIVSASWTMISSVMLRNNVFGQMTAYAGILAGVAGIVAVIFEHIAEFSRMDTLLEVAIFLYFAAIVFLFIWVVLAGRRLLQICTIRPEIDTG